MTITIPEQFNDSPINELTLIYDFKKYTFKPGESWKVDDAAGKHAIETYPFIKRMGDLKNIKEYKPELIKAFNPMANINLGQEDIADHIDGLSKEDFFGEGVETDTL